MRKIGFSIKHNNPLLISAIDKAIDSGFNHIELKLMSERINGNLLKGLIDEFSSSNISVSLHSPLKNVNIGSLDEKIRVSSVDRILQSIGLASSLGAEYLVFHGGKIPQGNSRAKVHIKKALDAQVQSIDDILAFSEDFSLTCAIENGYTLKDLGLVVYFDDFKDIIEKFPRLAILVDIGHFRINSSLQKMSQALDMEICDRIVAIHLHDNRERYDDHLVLGKGSIFNEIDQLRIILEKLSQKTIILENSSLEDAVRSKNNLFLYKLIQGQGKKFKKSEYHKSS